MTSIEWPADLCLPALQSLALTNSTLVLGSGVAAEGRKAATLSGLVQGCPSLRWLFLGGATLAMHAPVMPGAVPRHEPPPLPLERLAPEAARAALGVWPLEEGGAVVHPALAVEATFVPQPVVDELRDALPPLSRLLRFDCVADVCWMLQAAHPDSGRSREDAVRACFEEPAGAPVPGSASGAGATPPLPGCDEGGAGRGGSASPAPPGASEAAPPPLAPAPADDPGTRPRFVSGRRCLPRDTTRLADVLWPPGAPPPVPSHAGHGHALAFATAAARARHTPLHAAALSSNRPLVRALLRLQGLAASPEVTAALLERKDDRGASPLLRACEDGDALVVGALLAAGAAPGARNHKEETPLYICALKGHAAAVAALVERLGAASAEAPPPPVADEAVSAVPGDAAAAAEAAALPLTGPDGWTALHAAALSGSAPVLSLLLAAAAGEEGAPRPRRRLHLPVDARTRYGSTPLHVAASLGRVDAVRLLLGAGADARAIDSCGDCARTLVVRKRRGLGGKLRGAAADVGGSSGGGSGRRHAVAQAAEGAAGGGPTAVTSSQQADFAAVLALLPDGRGGGA